MKADISVISMHTNLDIAPGGVNDALAEALRIEDPGPMPGDETRPLPVWDGCETL